MSDDIVTQLRYIYSQKDVGVSVNPDTFTEAADEIERLRAENDGLRVRIYSLLNKLDEQAVRG